MVKHPQVNSQRKLEPHILTAKPLIFLSVFMTMNNPSSSLRVTGANQLLLGKGGVHHEQVTSHTHARLGTH